MKLTMLLLKDSKFFKDAGFLYHSPKLQSLGQILSSAMTKMHAP